MVQRSMIWTFHALEDKHKLLSGHSSIWLGFSISSHHLQALLSRYTVTGH